MVRLDPTSESAAENAMSVNGGVNFVSPGRHYFPGADDGKVSPVVVSNGDIETKTLAVATTETSENLFFNYWKAISQINRSDLTEFCRRHDELFAEAKRTNDHSAVTEHYYSVMSGVIEQYYGGSFHFVPPNHPGESMRDATKSLHKRIATLLRHGVGKHCLDIGCGVGEAMVDIARECGGRMTGITIAPNEVQRGNESFVDSGVGSLCHSVVGDAHIMPFQAETFDNAYAVYALKYFPDVRPVLKEVNRVLKPGGLFLVYDLVKTDKYDSQNQQHKQIVEGIEYACGMPSLHTNAEMSAVGAEIGLETVCQMDITVDRQLPFYYHFVSNRWFVWMIESPWMDTMFRYMELGGIVPTGFARFAGTFLSGTINNIVKGGQNGILTGSNIIIFRKKEN